MKKKIQYIVYYILIWAIASNTEIYGVYIILFFYIFIQIWKSINLPLKERYYPICINYITNSRFLFEGALAIKNLNSTSTISNSNSSDASLSESAPRGDEYSDSYSENLSPNDSDQEKYHTLITIITSIDKLHKQGGWFRPVIGSSDFTT